ncbi:MAG: TadE/TadG family type IV pilus assembly protein [Propioniciclava sp.]
MSRTPRRRDRGSASLEFVAMFPVLLTVGIAALQLGIAGWATTSATDAARAAARAASLGESPSAAAQGVLPAGLTATSVDGGRLGNGYSYTVTVDIPDVVPFFTPGQVSRTVDMPDIS